MYQVYYVQTDGSYDFLPEVRFTKKMAKEHFETFDNIEDAINMIFKYDYVLAEFNLIFLNVFFGFPVFLSSFCILRQSCI